MDTLQEGFNAKVQIKVLTKFASIISKKIGQKVSMSEIPMGFTRDGVDYIGFFGVIGSDKAIRINFLMSEDSTYIHEIDTFNNSGELETTIEFTKQDNIIQIINSTVDLLEYGVLQEGRAGVAMDAVLAWIDSNYSDNVRLVQDEALSRVYTDYYEPYAYSNGITPISKISFINKTKEYLKDNNMTNRYAKSGVVKQVGKGKVISTNKADENKFNEEMKMSVDERFAEIDLYAKMVATGRYRALVVSGQAGLGKSYRTLKTLKEAGISFKLGKGGIKSTFDFYKVLYRNNGDILVLDDIDKAISQNVDIINMIKGALDTNPMQEGSLVVYKSKDTKSKAEIEMLGPKMKLKAIPDNFIYTGSLILLTNIPLKKLDQAIRSRALLVDMQLTKEQVIDHIEKNINEFPPNVSMDTKLDALNFIKEFQDKIPRMDFRLFESVVALFSSVENGSKIPMIRKMAYNQIINSI